MLLEADARRLTQAITVIGQIRLTALRAWSELENDGDKGSSDVQAALEAHAGHLFTLMPEVRAASNLIRHVHFNQKADYRDIIFHDLAAIEGALAKWIENLPKQEGQHFGFEELLHPLIAKNCLPLYEGNHYRESVWTAYQQVFGEIRRQTGREEDGSDLIGLVFSLRKPLLVVGDLNTETGQNQQKGLIQLLQGAYQAFRNPLAHSGGVELRVSARAAARHMVFASLLLNRLARAKSATP